MLKNYSTEVIEKIQQCISESKFNEMDFKSFEDFPKQIYSSGVLVKLFKNDIYDSYHYPVEILDKEYYNNWKSHSVGKFYAKDWKYQLKYPEVYKLYKEFTIQIQDATIVCLVRKLQETELPTINTINEILNIEETADVQLSEEDTAKANEIIKKQEEDRKNLIDLEINGEYYSIIKLYVKEFETYATKSMLEECPKLVDFFEIYEITKADDTNEIVNIDNNDENSSIELF